MLIQVCIKKCLSSQIYQQTVQRQQQVAFVPRPLDVAAQGPTTPAWGSAYYNGGALNQGIRAEPIGPASYVPFQNTRSGGSGKYVDTPAVGSGAGRGSVMGRRGAGRTYDRFQVKPSLLHLCMWTSFCCEGLLVVVFC